MPLSLEAALDVLNRRRHRGKDTWHVIPGLRRSQVRESSDASSATWLSDFEAVAIAEQYLRGPRVVGTDEIDELKIFLCRGGGIELLGVRPAHGDRGDMIPMIAGDERRVAELREIARAQVEGGIFERFRLCRFVNVQELERIE